MFLFLLLITTITVIFVYLKWNFSYWQRKGFPYYEPKIPFGVLDSVRRRERSLGMAIYDVYTSSQEKVLGIYLMLRPALLIRDAQLARDILSKEFSSFHDRGVYVDEKNDPLSGSLFNLEGQKWKSLRSKLAPSFTSGKLKSMFSTIENVSDEMIEHLNTILPEEGYGEVGMRKLLSMYAIDIIASVIFGLDVNTFKNPNNPLYEISTQINTPNFAVVLRGTCQFLYPNLEKLFIRLGWYEDPPKAMHKIASSTIEYREKNNISRKDMLQLLIQLRNSGKINADDNIWSVETAADSLKSMSTESIAAQLFLFYIAGYETTASAASFTIYELAQYPEVMAKAKADVEHALKKHGKFTFEAIQDMKYLDACVMETIRKFPGLPILNRECTQNFQIPDTDKNIEKGTPIIISLFGIHRDPEYFPDPLRFDPDRFLEENMNYNPIAYMPFGEGPRHCIAQRMGKVNTKVAIAKILTHFDIEPKSEHAEIEIENFGVVIIPKGGVTVRLAKKKNTKLESH